MPAAADFGVRSVLQLLPPFRRDGTEKELHRQQHYPGELCLWSGHRSAVCDALYVAGSHVPGGVLGQGGVPVWKGQPTAVPVSDYPIAVDSEDRPGGKAHQPGPEGHWPWQQSGQHLPTLRKLPAHFLHAHYLDDLRPCPGIRLHALPRQPPPWPDGFLYLPL